jgi:ABC-2 type transport system ATP-binding protein
MPATQSSAIDVTSVSYWYGERRALHDVSFAVEPGEIFALLGPNGGGKSTLFRLLTTLMPLAEGQIRIFAADVQSDVMQVRRQVGVVFQSPSLDRKLTVEENLIHHAALYGLSGRVARDRAAALLEKLGVLDRRRDLVESLSGGLRRRVELAKGMMHQPRLLLMDEPSTGLDPAARSDLWTCLRDLREQQGVTVALTTHLLEEADKADRIAILDRGSLVAWDTPANLRAALGGDSISITTDDAEQLASEIQAEFAVAVQVLPGLVRMEQVDGHRWIPRLVERFPQKIQAISLGKPTLEDVFIARTGHRFWSDDGRVNDRRGKVGADKSKR